MQGRNPARFNGCYGVPRGFKGEKSKFPPNPLGLAERVLRPQTVEGVRVQCLSILYTFVPICDSNKYIKTFVKPCFSKKKHHMPDVSRAYDAYEAYEVRKRFFREDGGRERRSTHGVRTPSTARGAVPLPRRGRSWGFAGQGLPALPSIAYRGFAVAPITLRAPARRGVITSGINGRAMRAPTGDGGATDGCKYI